MVNGLPPTSVHTSGSSTAFAHEVDSLLEINKVPAAAVAVFKNGKIQEIGTFGYLVDNVNAPQDAIFNVASLTKPIVSMLTLKLVQDGKWDLDQPLYSYWVDEDVKDDPRHKLLTSRHILSHQSGFKNWRSEGQSGKLEFDFEPGTDFRYSGEGFEYLKKALESKFGMSLEDMADSLLFKSLNMDDTNFYWDDTIEVNKFARWHDANGDNTYKTYRSKSANAADDLLTTIGDYSKFAAFILNGGGLSSELYSEMISTQNKSHHKVKMGLGWEILPGLSGTQYAMLHTGGDYGVQTLIMLMPETGEGIIIFTNGDNGKNLFFPLIENHLSLGPLITGKAE
ncbi:MAG: serine hydrolase domain-containing protein [Flavobacteriaceae bacterium]|nr:serine hydrolase domain-containing protein [Flavobacteriaceae bacterium]